MIWPPSSSSDIFGHASGLHTNIAKSSVTLIQCIVETYYSYRRKNTVKTPKKSPVATNRDLFVSMVDNLGLPLSVRKLTKAELLPLVDNIADQLPN